MAKTKKLKWTFTYGMKAFTSRREATPTGRLTILGRQLSLEETKNYLGANK